MPPQDPVIYRLYEVRTKTKTKGHGKYLAMINVLVNQGVLVYGHAIKASPFIQ